MRPDLFQKVVQCKLRTSAFLAILYWLVTVSLVAFAFGADRRLPPLALFAAGCVVSWVASHVFAWGFLKVLFYVQLHRGGHSDVHDFANARTRMTHGDSCGGGISESIQVPVADYRLEAPGETRYFSLFPFGPIVIPVVFFLALLWQGFLVVQIGSNPDTRVSGWSEVLPLSIEMGVLATSLATVGIIAGCYSAGSGIPLLNELEITPRRVVVHSLTQSRVFRAGRDAVCLRSPTARSPLVWVVLSSRHGPAVSMCVTRACAEHMRAVWSGRPRRSRGAGRDYGTADTLRPCSARSNER